jgi:hypothetical protein
MDAVKVKASAEKLAALLLRYSATDEEAKKLQGALAKLLSDAAGGLVVSPLDWRDIPGAYHFNEGGLRKYPDLETAYAELRIELTGGESPVLRELRLRTANKGT